MLSPSRCFKLKAVLLSTMRQILCAILQHLTARCVWGISESSIMQFCIWNIKQEPLHIRIIYIWCYIWTEEVISSWGRTPLSLFRKSWVEIWVHKTGMWHVQYIFHRLYCVLSNWCICAVFYLHCEGKRKWRHYKEWLGAFVSLRKNMVLLIPFLPVFSRHPCKIRWLHLDWKKEKGI